MVFTTEYEKYFTCILVLQLLVPLKLVPEYASWTSILGDLLLGYGLYHGFIRFHLVICYFVHLLNTCILYFWSDNYEFLWAAIGAESLLILCLLYLGAFSYVEPSGPYGIGHREVVLKETSSLSVSVFYPIERAVFDKYKMDPSKTSSFWLEGFNDVKGFALGLENIPKFLIKDILNYRLLAINNGELHNDFKSSGKLLTPIVLSHGLNGNRTSHSALVYNLVSYGCIVYSITHTDSSASYFKDYNRVRHRDVYYTSYSMFRHRMPEACYRSQQLDTRMKNVQQVLDLIESEEKSIIPAINMEKLVAMGHGFGGLTAIEMSFVFRINFKLWVALDPYFSGRASMITKTDGYTLEQPLMIVSTEFSQAASENSDYDLVSIHKKFYEETCRNNKNERNYNLVLKGTDRYNLEDYALYNGAGLKLLGLLPFGVNIREKYIENSKSVWAFLDEHQFLPVKLDKKVLDVISQ